jgi:hypothetical protein
MTINSGPDQGQTNVDHEARLITLRMEFEETGTVNPDAIWYLLQQAEWAIKLDKAGFEMAEAGMKFVAASDKAISDLQHKLLVSELKVALLQTALDVEDDK